MILRRTFLFLVCCLTALGLFCPQSWAVKTGEARAGGKAATAKKVTTAKKGKATSRTTTSAKAATVKKGGKKLNAAKGGSPVKVVKALPPLTVADPSQVMELKYWSNPDYTRIAVTLDHETTFNPHVLKPTRDAAHPERIYIDIANSRMAPGVKDIPIGDGLLKTARIGQYQPDVVRIVLDVQNIRDYKIFPLSNPYRIIIDVKGERREELSSLPAATISTPPAAMDSTPAEGGKAPPRSQHPSPVRRIVVDPGHGGKDPGAVGTNGTQEKEVVLSLSLRLAERLRRELGVEVFMTRSTDVFIPLEERTAIANKLNADLFISVHANASLNRSAMGLETYYLNLAKTEKAAQLAARENGTTLEKVSLLQAILFDLMANSKINESAHLAEEVQKATHRTLSDAYAGVKNLGVKQGPFYVLVGATMPSILVEAAFISNALEEENLQDPQFLDTVAYGIMKGVRAYAASLGK